jgi:hypothetical protein
MLEHIYFNIPYDWKRWKIVITFKFYMQMYVKTQEYYCLVMSIMHWVGRINRFEFHVNHNYGVLDNYDTWIYIGMQCIKRH